MFIFDNGCFYIINTAISRKIVGKYVHATIPKGIINNYTVRDAVAVEPTVFVAYIH